MDKKERELYRLSQVFSFEEILEECDLTEEEVLSILYDLGYVRVPPYLEDSDYEQEAEEDEESFCESFEREAL